MPVHRKAEKPVSSLPKRKPAENSPTQQGNALLRHSPNNARLAAAKPPQVIPFDIDSVPLQPDVYALIHYELARLHKIGRLAQIDKTNYDYAVQAGIADKEEFDATPDTPAAFYHYQKAAHGGCVEAALALAHIHKPNQSVLQLLHSVSLEDSELKLKYLKLAADRWCQPAIYHYANAQYSGTECEQDWPLALMYFEKLINPTHDFIVINNLDEFYDWEVTFTAYELKAKMAEMLSEGGNGLEQDAERAVELYYEAAEDAVKAGKGKLSMQYYEAAAALE